MRFNRSPRVGYQDIIGAAIDELDALDHVGVGGMDAYPAMGGYGGFGSPAVGLRELIGALEPSDSDFIRLMAAAGDDAPAGNGGGLAALAARMNEMRQIDPRAVIVRERAEDSRREYPLGFDSGPTLIAAGGTFNVQALPQVTFRSERLLVPSFLAPFFTIDNIIVGKDSQTAAGFSPVPATTYSEVAVGVRLNLRTANLGNTISIAGTNIDVAPHRFRASIIGTATDLG